MTPAERAEIVFTYHERTKHYPQRFARSLGYLDWESQPDPFRRYEGCDRYPLPLANADTSPLYEAMLTTPLSARPVTEETIGLLFEHALAISAWKEYQGARWALRCNPSSGNLHPTEGYLVAGPTKGFADAPTVYHYTPKEHALEVRHTIAPEEWSEWYAPFPHETFFVGLTSVVWREVWKYGERAYRYCQHDAGHAIAAVALSAAALGWRAVHIAGLSDDALARLLGLGQGDPDNAEREAPDALLAIVPNGEGSIPQLLDEKTIAETANGLWMGVANVLSAERVEWPIIDAVAEAAAKPHTTLSLDRGDRRAPIAVRPYASPLTFNTIARQRRSAVDMDGITTMSRDAFYTMMARTLPGALPFDVLGAPSCVHLAVFVHRVDNLQPGLYALLREPESGARFQSACTKPFLWETPESCPVGLPLYRLAPEDCRGLAKNVGCGQDIAGDGTFSLGMLVEFRAPIETQGPWWYRRLFWETGVIGQVLYLEAEATGLRATGIGCFFDDLVHQILGLKDNAFQSLYHFTVGGPVEDTRLTTLPPYGA